MKSDPFTMLKRTPIRRVVWEKSRYGGATRWDLFDEEGGVYAHVIQYRNTCGTAWCWDVLAIGGGQLAHGYEGKPHEAKRSVEAKIAELTA